ncbi:hypothetical protein F5Y08DRAFT_353804 [Xylaria arbuscula]|nr:hypothetical protein F5Y08DRAFT_353804 [Xylaria arbuscula]
MEPPSSSEKVQKIVVAATKRSSSARSSLIENVAGVTELKRLIIESLLPDVSSISSIHNLALAGPVLYKLVTEDEATIAEGVVINRVGRRLMPIAAALFELRALGDRLPRSYNEGRHFQYNAELMQPVVEILDRHIGPGRQVNWKKEGTLGTFCAAHDCLTFDSVVVRWVRILAPRLMEIVSRGASSRKLPEPPRTEMLRFHKALYLLELAHTAFPWETPVEGDGAEDYKRLCDQVSPWEMEQTRSLQLNLVSEIPMTKKITRIAMYEPQVHAKLTILFRFVLAHDLTTLLAMYDKGEQTKSAGVDEYQTYCETLGLSLDSKPRLFAFPMTAEIPKFRRDGQGNTDLDAGEIFMTYPEDEHGPKSWWYFRFLTSYGGLTTIYSDRHLFRKCQVCLPASGLAFCDFERLSKLAREDYGFPEPNGLLDWVRSRSGHVNSEDLLTSIQNSSEMSAGWCRCPRR